MYQNDYIHIDYLVDQVKANNNQALWELYDFYKPIIKVCVNKVHNKYKTIEKGDLISECVFVLKDLCDKYDKNKSYFSYYFDSRLQPYLIAKIKSKYLQKINIVDLSADETYEFDVVEGMEETAVIHDAIKKLPPNLQKVIDLFYFKGLNQSECALILNISQPALSKRLKRALAILQLNLKKEL